MNKPIDAFEARREEVEREILVPPFPADVTHYDDGSWECSGVSFDRMARSFKRFGFELDYRWSFDTLYTRFSFILRSSSLISALDLAWVVEQHDSGFVGYLRAVAARDDIAVSQTLPAALQVEASRLAAEGEPLPDEDLAPVVQTQVNPDSSEGRGRLYLVRP